MQDATGAYDINKLYSIRIIEEAKAKELLKVLKINKREGKWAS